MPLFDLGYCFLKIRAKSVGNEIELNYRDNIDDKIYSFMINLDELEVTFPEGHEKNIQLDESLGLVMQYPTVEMLDSISEKDSEEDITIALIKQCIESIYDKDNVYNTKEYSDAEMLEFIESIESSKFKKIEKFFDTMPILEHTLTYTDTAGTEKIIILNDISDFF